MLGGFGILGRAGMWGDGFSYFSWIYRCDGLIWIRSARSFTSATFLRPEAGLLKKLFAPFRVLSRGVLAFGFVGEGKSSLVLLVIS